MAATFGTDILGTGVGVAEVGQAHVGRQGIHDAGRGDLAVTGISHDRRAQSLHREGVHAPVREVAGGLVLEELHTGIRVEEAGDANEVHVVGLIHAFTHLGSSPAGAVQAPFQAPIGDFTRLQECIEGILVGGPHGAAGVPTNGEIVVDCGGRWHSHRREGRTHKKAGQQTLDHESNGISSFRT